MKEELPMTRIEDKSGTVWYPKYHRNTKGELELNDKSFQKMFTPRVTSEKPVKTVKESPASRCPLV